MNDIYKNAGPELDFATLDARGGFPAPRGTSPLETWYRSVQKTKISALDTASLARAVRQGIHLPVTVPVAVDRLQSDAWLGELYPGELAAALAEVPFELWSELGAPLVARASKVVEALRNASEEDAPVAEVRDSFEQLHRRLLAAKLGAAIVVERGDTEDKIARYELSPDADAQIGKHLDNRVQVKDAARHQVIIRWRDDGYWLEELGHPGTRVNGKPVSDNGQGKHALAAKDTIEIGSVLFRYVTRS